MAYKTKPELEEGNFIVYTNEPDTVVDSADIGGGEGVLEGSYPVTVLIAESEGSPLTDPAEFNDVFNLGGTPISDFQYKTTPDGVDRSHAVANATAHSFDFFFIKYGGLTNYTIDSIMVPASISPTDMPMFFYMPPANYVNYSLTTDQGDYTIEITVIAKVG